MTRQESFKRRIRARMEKTGEKYSAARRALIDRSASGAGGDAEWASRPELDDQAIRDATGRGWNEWRDLIDADIGRDAGHGRIAAGLQERHGLDGWWAQSVTVGYERITGIRLPHQRLDGSFTASKSRTFEVDVEALRAMLLDDASRRDLFPGIDTTLRSKPGSKSLRIGMEDAVVLFSFDPATDGRTRLTVTHEQLTSPADVELWKKYWGEWLEAIAAG